MWGAEATSRWQPPSPSHYHSHVPPFTCRGKDSSRRQPSQKFSSARDFTAASSSQQQQQSTDSKQADSRNFSGKQLEELVKIPFLDLDDTVRLRQTITDLLDYSGEEDKAQALLLVSRHPV